MSTRTLVDALGLSAVSAVLIWLIPWQMVFSATTPTGGDAVSHYAALVHFNEHILPHWRLWGWNQGNLGGFSQFEFYFPLPFLVMSALGLIMPLAAAFKLGLLLPALALPFCIYGCLRLVRAHYPGSILGAVLSLGFILCTDHSVWGGNLASLLAGEFCYGWAFCLSWLFLGLLPRWLKGISGVTGPALLLTAVGLCHAYGLLFCVAAGAFAVLVRTDRLRAMVRLAWAYALAFLLLGFWMVPFVLSGAHSELFNFIWVVDSWRGFLPPMLWPVLILAPPALIYSFRRGEYNDRFRAGYMLGWLTAAAGLFLLAPMLNAITVRFAPFAQVTAVAVTACGLGAALRHRRAKGLAAVAIIAVAVTLPPAATSGLSGWLAVNNGGTEAADMWPDLASVYETLAREPEHGRIAYEHSPLNQRFGSTRAMEALPLWTGRPTLEGLYLQASPNAPFIFYIQSEISQGASTPLPLYHYSRFNPARAARHLALYNVGRFITMDPRTIRAAEAAPGFSPLYAYGPLRVFELTDAPRAYGRVPPYQPVAVVTRRPQFIAYQWFRFTDLQTPLVFLSDQAQAPPGRFAGLWVDDGNRANALLEVLRKDTLPRRPLPRAVPAVEDIGQSRMAFKGLTPGVPLWISVSYDRGWRASGGETIYRASPAFMLVYPRGKNLVLEHGATWPHYLGLMLSLLGLVLTGGALARPRPLEKHLAAVSEALGRRPRLPRRAAALVVALALGAMGWLWARHHDAVTLLNRGRELAAQGRQDQARQFFMMIQQRYGMCLVRDYAIYDMAQTYFSQDNFAPGVEALERLWRLYPDSALAPETLYHLAVGHRRLGHGESAKKYGEALNRLFPDSDWALRWNQGR